MKSVIKFNRKKNFFSNVMYDSWKMFPSGSVVTNVIKTFKTFLDMQLGRVPEGILLIALGYTVKLFALSLAVGGFYRRRA